MPQSNAAALKYRSPRTLLTDCVTSVSEGLICMPYAEQVIDRTNPIKNYFSDDKYQADKVLQDAVLEVVEREDNQGRTNGAVGEGNCGLKGAFGHYCLAIFIVCSST